MAVAFTHLSWWLWSGKHQDTRVTHGYSWNTSPESEVRELDTYILPLTNGQTITSTKLLSLEERKAVREYDAVIVPSDRGGFSESDSDDSDWSIGWLEPHGPGFESDNESADSFALLVPCYGRDRREMKGGSRDKFLNTVKKVPDTYAAASNKEVRSKEDSGLHSNRKEIPYSPNNHNSGVKESLEIVGAASGCQLSCPW